MEEYLENMNSLRSYINDLEEDAAKRSAEEQQLRTAIDAHDAEIVLVRAHVKQAREEAEQLAKARAQVCVDTAEKHGRVATLEVECATRKQTLEFLHQEIASTSVKLNEKSLFYTKTMENLTLKLQEQQEWFSSLENKVATSHRKQNLIEGEKDGVFNPEGSLDKLRTAVGGKLKEHNVQIESTQLKIEDFKSKRSALRLEINKSEQILEQDENIIAGSPAALQQMDMKSLEEEYKALQGDKAEEIEYVQSLDEMIQATKSISDLVKCCCGLEYKVELSGKAMDIS